MKPRARNMKTKNSNPATKMLPGHVERRRVRCGKSNCKCACGEKHIAHYHVWYESGVRFRRYIPVRAVKEMRRACDDYRALQVRLRAGRADYRNTIRRARELLSFLTGARRAGLL